MPFVLLGKEYEYICGKNTEVQKEETNLAF